ncbi:MAG: hypothetical protein R2883_07740 [Caldisericia bacterium]
METNAINPPEVCASKQIFIQFGLYFPTSNFDPERFILSDRTGHANDFDNSKTSGRSGSDSGLISAATFDSSSTSRR